MRSTRVCAPLLAALFALAACTGTGPAPAPTAVQPSPEISPSPSATVVYRHTDVDLCVEGDLAPLASFKITSQTKENKLPPATTADEAEMCAHEMKAADGRTVRLILTAIVYPSAAEAHRAFDGTERDSMTPVGALAGPWQQGAARTLENPANGSTEFLVHVVSDNLYVWVWLSVWGDSVTPPENLRPVATKLADTTFATVTRAWK